VSVVLSDPDGFAVDWDWQRGLTVWAVTGPGPESRFDRRLLDHRLAGRPAGESRAQRAARRWWQQEGHSRALSQAGSVSRDSAAGPDR
jgi:hypothetical protein